MESDKARLSLPDAEHGPLPVRVRATRRGTAQRAGNVVPAETATGQPLKLIEGKCRGEGAHDGTLAAAGLGVSGGSGGPSGSAEPPPSSRSAPPSPVRPPAATAWAERGRRFVTRVARDLRPRVARGRRGKGNDCRTSSAGCAHIVDPRRDGSQNSIPKDCKSSRIRPSAEGRAEEEGASRRSSDVVMGTRRNCFHHHNVGSSGRAPSSAVGFFCTPANTHCATLSTLPCSKIT